MEAQDIDLSQNLLLAQFLLEVKGPVTAVLPSILVTLWLKKMENQEHKEEQGAEIMLYKTCTLISLARSILMLSAVVTARISTPIVDLCAVMVCNIVKKKSKYGQIFKGFTKIFDLSVL